MTFVLSLVGFNMPSLSENDKKAIEFIYKEKNWSADRIVRDWLSERLGEVRLIT